jgi:cytochrome c biogenesis protein CcmG/thiol:disulfide interchange protein DsbE
VAVPSAAMDDGLETLPPEDRAPDAARARVPRGLLVALALAVVVLTIAGWKALPVPGDGVAADPGSMPGAGGRPAAPDTTTAETTSTYTAFDGSETNLAALRGSPVVLNFWASTCAPCIDEMPAFERVSQAYAGRVRFVGLAVHDPEASARNMARRTGVTYSLGFDPQGRIARAFGATGLPATILLGPDGGVVRHVGATLSGDELTGLIERELLGAGASG